jgi:hypothetical protein
MLKVFVKTIELTDLIQTVLALSICPTLPILLKLSLPNLLDS